MDVNNVPTALIHGVDNGQIGRGKTSKGKTLLKKYITITNNTPVDIDEVYEETFECPKCKNNWIYRNFNYCPHCGSPINWQI